MSESARRNTSLREIFRARDIFSGLNITEGGDLGSVTARYDELLEKDRAAFSKVSDCTPAFWAHFLLALGGPLISGSNGPIRYIIVVSRFGHARSAILSA
jgi:hypothetical protein